MDLPYRTRQHARGKGREASAGKAREEDFFVLVSDLPGARTQQGQESQTGRKETRGRWSQNTHREGSRKKQEATRTDPSRRFSLCRNFFHYHPQRNATQPNNSF